MAKNKQSSMTICNPGSITVDLETLEGEFEIEFASGDGVIASVIAVVKRKKDKNVLTLITADGMIGSNKGGAFKYTFKD